MTYNQPELLALPPRYTYPQQSNQRLEELAVQFDFLTTGVRRGGFQFGLKGGFLRGDGVAHPVDQGDEESEVDGARDAGAVGQVKGC
jgi:hypothetical protein